MKKKQGEVWHNCGDCGLSSDELEWQVWRREGKINAGTLDYILCRGSEIAAHQLL